MIIRRRHTANFTTIGNALFDDERLAADELGILAFLRSKPHDWEVRRPYLMQRFHMGRDGLRRVFNNYMRTGWCWAEKSKRPDGTFHVVYEIRDEPGPELSDEEIRRALSPESGEAATDLETKTDAEPCADAEPGGELCAPPVTCQPPLAEPPTARAYVVDSKRLNTELPRKDSTKIEREGDAAHDRKAKFITAFEMRWPTAASDDRFRTAKACRELPDDQEEASLNGIGPFLEKLKRDGRDRIPAGWRYLEQKPWTLLEPAKVAAAAVSDLARGTPEAKAVETLFAVAGKDLPYFMRRSDGAISYRREVTAQLLALATPPADWVRLDREQAGAWNEFLRKFIPIDVWNRLSDGSKAPWPWPPSSTGKTYSSTAPPDTLMTQADRVDWA